MKRKRFVKTCVSIVLVMVVALSSVIPVHAVGAVVGSVIEDTLWTMI